MGLFNNSKNINEQLDLLESKLISEENDIKMFDTSGLRGKLLERAKTLNSLIYAHNHNGKNLPTAKNDDVKKTFTQQVSEIKKDFEEKNNIIKCPKCSSTNVQFMQQDKKAFSVGKAVGGTVLTGGIGALAGFAGKKGKKQWFCQNCNSVFETK